MNEEITVKDNKPIEAGFQVRFSMIRKPVNIIVWCKDEYAITTMDNQQVLKKMVEVEQRNGTKIKLLDNNGKKIAIQKYSGKTKEQILEIIKSEIKKGSGGNFKEQ
jgi:hypothetical protein